MNDRFAYLLERVEDAPFETEPFPHLWLTEFLAAEDLEEVLQAPEVALPRSTGIDDLFDHLDEAGYERIDFPGCSASKDEYKRWLDEGSDFERRNPTCEAQGLAFRLAAPRTEAVVDLNGFFRSRELHDVLKRRFELTRDVSMEGGVHKYLHGYEISPHPDIRKKALTWMLNVSPGPAPEQVEMHTRYMRFRPEWSYVSQYWRHNPTAEMCWVPWDWCTTERKQTENNSVVFFSPRWDTLHGVRAHYDHLPAQRTQFYGNLWYEAPDPPTTAMPDHEDLNIAASSTEDVRARLADAERRAVAAEERLGQIRAHPAVRLAKRVRGLVRGDSRH